ncbi:hypothetical protein [Ancylobacter defluvii]|uniref:hypothetical protein n=1 Tax=Ancylobacter defluvii TaxID=1282440 RepID=UPI001BCFA1EA|nr:hypothetical protein [Ancylobacter defluvii]MBS7586070.1 hypothetical protein [Ancylobacter defluvii]
MLATAIVLFSGAATAEIHRPLVWQARVAQDLPMNFTKIKQAFWTQSVSLWAVVERDKTDWLAATQIICSSFIASGKPPEAFIVVTFLDQHALPKRSQITTVYYKSGLTQPQ